MRGGGHRCRGAPGPWRSAGRGPPPPEAHTAPHPSNQEPLSSQPGCAGGSGSPILTGEATQSYFWGWPPPFPPKHEPGGAPARAESARTEREKGSGPNGKRGPGRPPLPPAPSETRAPRALRTHPALAPAHPHRTASARAASSKQRPPLLAASAPASRALLGNGFPRLSSSSCHWLARTQVPGGHRPLPVPSSPSPPLPRPGRPERSRGLLLLARPCGLRRTLALGCFERRRYRVLEASHLQHSPVPTSATADWRSHLWYWVVHGLLLGRLSLFPVYFVSRYEIITSKAWCELQRAHNSEDWYPQDRVADSLSEFGCSYLPTSRMRPLRGTRVNVTTFRGDSADRKAPKSLSPELAMV